MRWRFVDKITMFDAWKRIQGFKAVSLEEYSLLEPLGREGEFPEALVLESAVQFSRWLVSASSDFQSSAELLSVEHFQFLRTVRAGELFRVLVEITSRSDSMIEACCEASVPSGSIASGVLRFNIVQLHHTCDPEQLKILWKELRAKAPQ